MGRKAERRRHQRFKVEDGSLAMLWPASTKVGQIIDIGMGGLSFRYLARSKPKDSFCELESEIEIICHRHRFDSEALPIETVSDTEWGTYYAELFPRQQRRRSVRFKELTDHQTAQLSDFIHRYCAPVVATGRAMP